MKTNLDLIEKLRSENLLSPDYEPNTKTTNTLHAIRVLQSFGAWLAMVFILIFVGIVFSEIFNNKYISLGLGLGMIAFAYLIYKGNSDDEEFAGSQFAITISLAGQALAVFGFAEIFGFERMESQLFSLVVLLFFLVLFFIIPNFHHRLWTSLASTVAFVFFVSSFNGYIFTALAILLGLVLWLLQSEFEHKEWMSLKQPAIYGLFLGMLGMFLFYGFGQNLMLHANKYVYFDRYLAIAIEALAALAFIWRLIEFHNGSNSTRILSAVFIVILGAIETKMPGLIAGIAVLIAGFSRGNNYLVGGSIAYLVWLIGHFYYSLHATLMVKSIYLFVSGALMIALYYLFKRFSINGTKGAK